MPSVDARSRPAAAPVGTVREEPPSPLAGAQRRVVLALSYDGAAFHGFAAQPRQRTVQGRIEEALAQITGGAVDSVCAGRTDAGVHALAQVLHVDLDAAYFARRQVGEEPFTEAPALAPRSLNKMLAPEVTVWRCFTAPEGFDARHSATARRYRYVIETGPRRDPLYRARAGISPASSTFRRCASRPRRSTGSTTSPPSAVSRRGARRGHSGGV